MVDPKWKFVEIVGWDADKGMWYVEAEMENPNLELRPGSETRTKYFYEAAVHYEGKSAGFPQMHATLGGSLAGGCWLFFDPPEGTILSVPLVERNAVDIIVDAASIVIPSKAIGCHAYDLLEGETICMEMDLWKCENGEMVKIEENSPECKEVKPKGPVCPIACVCMGTPLIDQLGPIREFRDEVLKRSRAGLTFVSLYYGKLSPHLSPLLEKSETLRRAGRILVRGILWRLKK
jgi:hypothetical protein